MGLESTLHMETSIPNDVEPSHRFWTFVIVKVMIFILNPIPTRLSF